MTHDTNRQVHLASRPNGPPARSNFEVVEAPVPEPTNNEVLVAARYLSVDPYMRLLMQQRWPVGEVMRAGVVGEVVDSRADGFAEGDLVTGSGALQELDWAEYTLATPEELASLDPDLGPLSVHLGVLGMTGRTAYFGMLDVGEPTPGDTVVVSGAAGAVGSVAGQLARLAGGRVVGTAGSDAKVEWLTDELGFDAAVNYKTTDDVEAALADACPDGVDVYLDRVGGEITDAVASFANAGARFAICGQIAHYNEEEPVGPRLLSRIWTARIEKFTVSQFEPRFRAATRRLARLVESGDLVYRETVAEGIERSPEAFLGLFAGENVGKQLVEV